MDEGLVAEVAVRTDECQVDMGVGQPRHERAARPVDHPDAGTGPGAPGRLDRPDPSCMDLDVVPAGRVSPGAVEHGDVANDEVGSRVPAGRPATGSSDWTHAPMMSESARPSRVHGHRRPCRRHLDRLWSRAERQVATSAILHAWSSEPVRQRISTQRLPYVQAAPADHGRVEMIVRRPSVDEREVVPEAVLDPDSGLVGDSWLARGSRSTPDGSADPEVQLTLISTRVLESIEPDRSRWPLAGDQVYVDLDLSVERLPAGTRLAIGSAVIQVSEPPHTGCAKFSARFGSDAPALDQLADGSCPSDAGAQCQGRDARHIHTGDEIRRV